MRVTLTEVEAEVVCAALEALSPDGAEAEALARALEARIRALLVEDRTDA